MHGAEEDQMVVFDVSLLAPVSLENLQAVLEKSKLTLVMTPTILKIFRKKVQDGYC